MEIIWNINKLSIQQPSILTLGTFDGVHLGHHSIIKRLNEVAKKHGGKSTLITFEPHPQIILSKADQSDIKLLTTIEEKIELLQNAELGRLVIANFTPEFAATEPSTFVKEILVKKLSMQYIVIGYDHAFGKARMGSYELLQEMSESNGYMVEVVEPVEVEGQVVSSTKIRKALLAGDVGLANKLLGRSYLIRGQVIKGDGRGRDLGFPTANIRPYSQYKLIPYDGVYAGFGEIDGFEHKCVISIGIRPTFNSKTRLIEVHFFDFQRSLYDREVDIFITHRIRDEIRFDTSRELVEQMQKDKRQSLELLDEI